MSGLEYEIEAEGGLEAGGAEDDGMVDAAAVRAGWVGLHAEGAPGEL